MTPFADPFRPAFALLPAFYPAAPFNLLPYSPATLRYQFATVARMSEHEQEVIRDLLDAVIVKNQVAGAIERVVKQAPARSANRSAAARRRAAHQR